MKKLPLFFLLLIVASCKKEIDPNINNGSKIETELPQVKVLKTDTIAISGYDTKTNYIIASLLKKTVTKEGNENVQYRLAFYTNNKQIASKDLTINDCFKDSEWSANYGLSPDDDSSVSPFIQLDYGVQTDGSLQKQYLFYLADKKLQLVHEWESSSDSGVGSWTVFLNANPKNEKQTFYSRSVSFDYKDDNNDTIGIATYSDTIKIYFENDQWKKQLLTPKGKIYRKKEVSIDNFDFKK
ncbi:hypothetical protein NJT12_00490 [Flavobacterium sp. AC]|uniref:Uncharacterized protein n=1 Tax=Flavobacterium azizsancarii TaxID=2961580 RepID=A0ABT4W6C4_9FLAO|nr:hypothetical protein [Flavobacterium azizsancarii]MDA6068081.1 hypothetical protein [Flavobacterium azizsancarii]